MVVLADNLPQGPEHWLYCGRHLTCRCSLAAIN
jgi:hypothetical protein